MTASSLSLGTKSKCRSFDSTEKRCAQDDGFLVFAQDDGFLVFAQDDGFIFIAWDEEQMQVLRLR